MKENRMMSFFLCAWVGSSLLGELDWGSLEISWGLDGVFCGFTRALLGAHWGFVVDLLGLIGGKLGVI